MPDYSRGKIYRIYSESAGVQYIGNTCEPTIAKRMVQHRKNYQAYKDGKYHYVSIFEVLEQDDYQYELIELYPSTCKDELTAREGYWIRKGKEAGDCVNIRVEGRTDKEYREDNKDKIKDYNKEYYEENKEYYKEYYEAHKDEIREKIKQKVTCECGSVVIRNSMPRHKRSKKHNKLLNIDL